MMRRPVRFWSFALLLRVALAQTQPDVAQILKKVSETYKAASQYELVGDATSHDARTGKDGTSHMRVAFQAPNRYRIEGGVPGMSVGDSDLSEGVIIDDGVEVWFYLPKSNQYGSFSASALTADAPGDLGDLRPEAVDYFMMGRYRGAADLTAGSKFLREDVIEVAGTKVTCYVVTVSPDRRGSARSWWIDKKRYRILREDQAGSSIVFTAIRLGEPLATELFRFVPPPGARKIEMHQ
jgi:outer membrane lipoprotein-sorting protein